MKHDPYSLTELIRNDDFIAWVRHPDADSEKRWQHFLDTYPEKRSVIEDARGYVTLLAEDTGKNKPSIEQSNKMWRVVESHMHQENVEIAEPDKVISGWRWIRIAASVLLILGISTLSYWYLSKGSYKGFALGNPAIKTEAGLIQKYNDSKKPMTVLLADGSSVVLQPGANVSFPAQVGREKREVYLTGKAFFEIVKNPQKPFFVYTDGIVTKVLGTSFLIDAPENGKEVKVEVRTGKVSVFHVGNNTENSESDEAEETDTEAIILNKDQKIAISKQNGKAIKLPEITITSLNAADISRESFVFDETPAFQVFAALEKSYNVKVIYDEALFKNCPLNATLIGQPLTEKLTVICTALEAQFEMKDSEIFISGKGCK